MVMTGSWQTGYHHNFVLYATDARGQAAWIAIVNVLSGTQ